MSEPFDSARDLLSWAREDALEFDSEVQNFFAGKPYTEVREIDPDTGNIVLKFRVAPVPDKLRKLASHAIWDLKHALDHATCAAVRTVLGPDPGDLHFPFASSPKDLTWKLTHVPKGKTAPRYPVALHTVFRSFEPYPTGNGYPGGSDELCAFNKMANTTKHAVALSAAPKAQVAGAKGTGGLVKLFPNAWDGDKNELTVGHIRPDTQTNVKLDIAALITFSQVELFEPHPAGSVLEGVGIAFEAMVDCLEAETWRIAGRMG